jgi:acyl-CoA dehydrogenase
MVDFVLNEEQKEYQKLARQVAQRELAPRAHRFDVEAQMPVDALRAVFESGLFNLQMPDALGGMGLSLWDAAVVAEELAAGCSGIGSAVEANALSLLPLLAGANQAQKERWLKPLMDDVSLVCLPADLFAPQPSCRLEAKRSGDGYQLSGEVSLAVNATKPRWYLVLAGLDGAFAKDSLTLFVVPEGTAGVSAGQKTALLGRRAADVCSLHFTDVSLTKENVLGTEGGATAILKKVRSSAYVLLAAASVGIARCALEHATGYAKERQTMGKPIGQHQAVAFLLADMAKDIEAARLLTWQAAATADSSGDGDATMASMARSFSQNMAMRVTTDAVQVFGGYGYSKEYPVEKLMRDAKMYQLFDGTSANLNVLIGRDLLTVRS